MPDGLWLEGLADAWDDAARRAQQRSAAFQQAERAQCQAAPAYFATTYAQIYDSVTATWIPFILWPAQVWALQTVHAHKYTVVLKARQEGLSWLLGCAYVLWQMLFRPIAEVLIFSQRDDEAVKLLTRVKGMYERLPDFLKPGVAVDSAHEFRLINGSGAQALPASAGGRSNAATLVVVDEADFIEKVGSLITAAKPTIDAGQNKMVVVSTVNIDEMGSTFQQLYTAARDNPGGQWQPVFLPWTARPDRTREWYDALCEEALRTEGTLDGVYKEYPETDAQALSARSLNTRYPPRWISLLSHPLPGTPLPMDAPVLPGLKIFRLPEKGRRYGMGCDPAGGLADSDDSAACVVDAETYEQVATLAGKFEPTTFADYCHSLSLYYYGAPVLFELNNHGHAVMAQFKERGTVMKGSVARDGSRGKPGWMTSERSKGKLWDTGGKVMSAVLANAINERGEIDPTKVTAIIHDPKTQMQLGTIDVNTMKAPEGGHDDYALAWVLSQECVYQGTSSVEMARHDLWERSDEQATGSATVGIQPVGGQAHARPDPRERAHAWPANTQRPERANVTSYTQEIDPETREKLAKRGIRLRR